MLERQATCSTSKSYHVSVKTNEQYIISKNNKKEAQAEIMILLHALSIGTPMKQKVMYKGQ